MDIRVVRTVDTTALAAFYSLYVAAFGDLAERAAARHLLTPEEFDAEMQDPGVEKYIAFDRDRAVAISTLTDDLTSVPWISPSFYAHRYPDHHARGAILYLGFTLVHPDYQRSSALTRMLTAMCSRAQQVGAVVGYDICAYNNDAHDFAAATERTMKRLADVTVKQIDVQTYYAMTFEPSSCPDD
ncbi:hypothetical protein [Solicola sp. PLA-1-18]|uniref:hypothetical protein n=1 Tax=Solicola sp. PLA-1-18 TaxID=3380532 RepID=UPI003B7B9370